MELLRGLGGLGLDMGSMALDYALACGGTPEATVYGTRAKLPAAMAAFVNGELMNALDWCALQPPVHDAHRRRPTSVSNRHSSHPTG